MKLNTLYPIYIYTYTRKLSILYLYTVYTLYTLYTLCIISIISVILIISHYRVPITIVTSSHGILNIIII